MQKKRKWKIEQPQLVSSGTTSTLVRAECEVEQELQIYSDEAGLLQKELKCNNQTKDELLSVAAHELRTPITVIRAYAQMVERNLAMRPDVASDLTTLLHSVKIINEQTHRLSELVDKLLDPVSMGDGKMQLHREWSNLA